MHTSKECFPQIYVLQAALDVRKVLSIYLRCFALHNLWNCFIILVTIHLHLTLVMFQIYN
jgi:quinol-cytochrome oxidoreductase complex cytochrome b subunit